MELESLQADDGAEEVRAKLSALPVRLRIDQNVVSFLQGFFAEDHKDTLFDSFEKLDLECVQGKEDKAEQSGMACLQLQHSRSY